MLELHEDIDRTNRGLFALANILTKLHDEQPDVEVHGESVLGQVAVLASCLQRSFELDSIQELHYLLLVMLGLPIDEVLSLHTEAGFKRYDLLRKGAGFRIRKFASEVRYTSLQALMVNDEEQRVQARLAA